MGAAGWAHEAGISARVTDSLAIRDPCYRAGLPPDQRPAAIEEAQGRMQPLDVIASRRRNLPGDRVRRGHQRLTDRLIAACRSGEDNRQRRLELPPTPELLDVLFDLSCAAGGRSKDERDRRCVRRRIRGLA
jgi:hypothetical protein